MEFTLGEFANQIRETLYTNFPYENDTIKRLKHPNTPEHIRDVALKRNPIVNVDENTITFDIGNEFAEEKYPYYHILEDAYAIRKRGRATKKTRGKQAEVERRADRNYALPMWNGKTFVKEYQRNVRGSRNRLKSVSRWVENARGEKEFINREANSYLNTHYHYIERTLDGFLPIIAQGLGLIYKSRGVGDIVEELAVDWGTDIQTVLDTFNIHEGE